jgi:CelD/BcsL family acetyltransferase involved in cellulose biosynthesis
VEVVDVPAVSHPLWQTLVTQRRSDVFHSPAWASVLTDTYGFEVRARVLHQEGQPLAGLAVVTVDDHLGRRHVSLPFSDFCDPLVDDAAQLRGLMADLLSGPDAVTIRRRFGDYPMVPELSEVSRFAWHGIDVTADIDSLWAGIDPGARRAIRKAEAAGLTVRAATSPDEVRAFFAMHMAVRKHKYRLLSQPWRFFESIWDRFLSIGDGVLMLAELDGRPIGGVLFLSWRDTLYYKFNASDLGNLAVRPNDLVLWEGMKWAHERRLELIDLGVSDLDQPGLIRYKQKYASREGHVTVHRKPPDRITPGTGEARALLGEMTALFVDPSVSDTITERAGEVLYRFFV